MRLWVSGYRSYELGVFKLDDPKIEVLKYYLRKIFMQNADLGSFLGDSWGSNSGH